MPTKDGKAMMKDDDGDFYKLTRIATKLPERLELVLEDTPLDYLHRSILLQ
jgi:hypothetical protein